MYSAEIAEELTLDYAQMYREKSRPRTTEAYAAGFDAIAKLMEQQKVETPQYVTVAVNNAFVPMDRYECFWLKEGDTVEFLYYMGGGCDGTEQ